MTFGPFRPSGGVLYHLRARRHGGLWQPFAKDLATWLNQWDIPRESLLLIGPSGGYTLPTTWLNQFKHIDAYDADPLAGFFFRRRHPGARVHMHRRNVFWEGGRLSLKPLAQILMEHPKTPVLFSNVLGQVLLEGHASEAEWQSYLALLRRALSARPWASYHDVLTHEQGEVIDHLTVGPWTDGLDKTRFQWNLTPNSTHEIEGVRA